MVEHPRCFVVPWLMALLSTKMHEDLDFEKKYRHKVMDAKSAQNLETFFKSMQNTSVVI